MTTEPHATGPTKTRLDSKTLQVLAHPLRIRLLGALRRDGEATATGLAKLLGTNTGATSYHLRKLAGVGLVEEISRGTGRERWWRAVHKMHSWFASDFDDDPEAQAAVSMMEGEGMRIFQDFADQWGRDKERFPVEWRDAGGTSDYLLRMSARQLSEMHEQIYAVVESYLAIEPDDGAHEVLFYLHAFPQARSDRP